MRTVDIVCYLYKVCRKYLVLGPVDTSAFSNENANIFIRFYIDRHTNTIEKGGSRLLEWGFLKRTAIVIVWTVKTNVFQSDEVNRIE